MENINNYRIANTCESCKFSMNDEVQSVCLFCIFDSSSKNKQSQDCRTLVKQNGICDNFEKG